MQNPVPTRGAEIHAGAEIHLADLLNDLPGVTAEVEPAPTAPGCDNDTDHRSVAWVEFTHRVWVPRLNRHRRVETTMCGPCGLSFASGMPRGECLDVTVLAVVPVSVAVAS